MNRIDSDFYTPNENGDKLHYGSNQNNTIEQKYLLSTN